MKRNHSNLCHNWANKTGKMTDVNSMFYTLCDNVSTLYSYGYHFAIATIDKNNVCLFTKNTYSNSTAKHINHAKRALNTDRIIYVYNNTDQYISRFDGRIIASKDMLKNEFKRIQTDLNTLISKHINAIKYSYENQINSLLGNAVLFADYFKCKSLIPKKLKAVMYSNNSLELLLNKDQINKLKQRQRNNIKRKAEKLRKDINAFKAFKSSYINSDKTYLRLKDIGIIETSKGISIDVNNKNKLLTLYKLAKRSKDRNTVYKPNYSFNGFNIDYIDNGTLKAGCHIISFSELLYIAERL